MDRLFGPVDSVVEIKGRGCMVVIRDKDIAQDVVLGLGDVVALKSGGKAIRTVVRDFGPGRSGASGGVGVLLGRDVREDMIPAGAALWKIES